MFGIYKYLCITRDHFSGVEKKNDLFYININLVRIPLWLRDIFPKL